jgi:hypothetical protein
MVSRHWRRLLRSAAGALTCPHRRFPGAGEIPPVRASAALNRKPIHYPEKRSRRGKSWCRVLNGRAQRGHLRFGGTSSQYRPSRPLRERAASGSRHGTAPPPRASFPASVWTRAGGMRHYLLRTKPGSTIPPRRRLAGDAKAQRDEFAASGRGPEGPVNRGPVVSRRSPQPAGASISSCADRLVASNREVFDVIEHVGTD